MTSLRYALRSLRRSPGFVVISVLALGVGLGLSTTMFAVLDAVINPHSAMKSPRFLHTVVPFWGTWANRTLTSAEAFDYVESHATSFEAIAPVLHETVGIEHDGRRERAAGLRVDDRWFTATAVQPIRGRRFTRPDGDHVALVSRDIWERQLRRSNDLAGASLMLDGRPHAIVGVMPRAAGAAIWRPLPTDALGRLTGVPVRATYIVRRRGGVSVETAQTELQALARQLTERHRLESAPVGLAMSQHAVWGMQSEQLRDIHIAMVGAALAVLLIACANLAHLMLARGLAKRRELALRMAIGASRAAVVRQLFIECALIAVAGAALAAIIAVWGADILRNRMPPEISWVGLVRPQLSWRVFALGAGAVVLSAILFGLLPAVRVVTRISLDEPLKESGSTSTGRVRQRYSPLVISEVALALVLLMGTGLLLRTLAQLKGENVFGFDARTLYRGDVALDWPRDTSRARPLVADLLPVVRALPGVVDVALVSWQGLMSRGGAISAELSGDSNRTIPTRSYTVVSPSYLRVLGLPILSGRDFQTGDDAANGVAIIDPIAAQRLYPGQDPVGRMLKLGGPMHHGPWLPIVGVARSPYVLEATERFAPEPSILVVRHDLENRNATMVIRTTTRGPAVATAIQGRLREMPSVAAVQVRAYDYYREAELTSRAFLAGVFAGMGTVALALAVLGLYGVLAYAVGQRMREFAIRIALGAAPAALRRMVLRDGFVMLLAGIGVGAFAALAATQLLDAVLVSVLPSDVISLVASEAILFTVGLVAALAPARRAERASPLDILRAT